MAGIRWSRTRSGLTAPKSVHISMIARDEQNVTPWSPLELGHALVGWWQADRGVTLLAAPVPNLVDGDMEAATTAAWSIVYATATKQAGTRTGGTGTKVLRVTFDGIHANGFARQSILVVGNTYRVTGWARSVDGVAIPHVLDGEVGISWDGTSSTEWQAFDITGTAKNAAFDCRCFNLAAGGAVEFDDITITRADGGGFIYDGNCEADGYAAWTALRANLSKPTTGQHSGTKCLRIAANGVDTSPFAYQSNRLVVGNTYRVTGWARSDGNIKPTIGMYEANWTGTTSTAWQPIDVTFTQISAGDFGFGSNASGTQYVEFDDITVTCLNVTAWADQSGNGRHLTQATAANRPYYSRNGGQDGKPVIKFDGVNDYLKTAAFPINQPSHYVIAYKARQTEDYDAIVDGITPGTRNVVYTSLSGTTGMFGYAGNSAQFPNTYTDRAWSITDVVFNGASSKIGLNGGQQVVADAGPSGSSGVFLGGRYDSAYFPELDVVGLMVASKELTASERANTVRHFSDTGLLWSPALIPGCIMYGGPYWAGRVTRAAQPVLLDGACQDVSKWTAGSSATLSNEADGVAGNCMRVTYGGVDNPYAYQNILIQGNQYSVTGYARLSGGTSANIYTGAQSVASTTSATWAAISGQGEALLSPLLRCYMLGTGAGNYAEFDSLTVSNLSLTQFVPKYLAGRVEGTAFVQATAAAQPWVSSDGRGIRYQAGDKTVWSASSDYSKCLHDGSGATFIIAVRPVATTAAYVACTYVGSSAASVGMALGYDSTNLYFNVGNGSGTLAFTASAAATFTANTTYVLTLRIEAGTGGIRIRQNGVQKMSGTLISPSSAVPSHSLTFGTDSTYSVDGIIGHPVLYNRVLTDAECAVAEAYILAQPTL